MPLLFKILSFIALTMTLIPSFLVFQGIIEPSLSKTLMFIGTVLWFLTAPRWLNKSQEETLEE
ncbi:hypothetical protein P872_16930 [Rhodonellum psychrophilum GCM71 = DSM 17998]|uniref:Uncharacterized protein n=1 Tax=Rhodonellum psychrophilum GCM71 = DSM 17998 TaxID=1123057 RepID=U5C4R9_9BACT|nr:MULTISPECIES: hypothetical protein [Rhodonellum]ERM83207.1 hypothetical protein P872_16930 [Rhodonellum psychrophilum GCM71 = DSM 17998]MDO9551766.1 hypothetical protein [Rhodonellum sp.]